MLFINQNLDSGRAVSVSGRAVSISGRSVSISSRSVSLSGRSVSISSRSVNNKSYAKPASKPTAAWDLKPRSKPCLLPRETISEKKFKDKSVLKV